MYIEKIHVIKLYVYQGIVITQDRNYEKISLEHMNVELLGCQQKRQSSVCGGFQPQMCAHLRDTVGGDFVAHLPVLVHQGVVCVLGCHKMGSSIVT